MNDMQKQVQEAVDRLVESGTERGLQVAVYRNGEPVVDVVAGVADPATGRPVTPDTPFYSASTGKGVTSTVVHVLVERGVLGYDTPIVELWPEFGAHGKERATVRHALTHSAGVPGVPAGTTPEDLCDWEGMCAAIADAKPWWEPGTRTGYHPHSFGYIIGEIVRRATGRPISRVLREEVAGPLGVAGELFLGVPESELGRLARLEDAPSDFEMPAEMSAEMFADIPFFKVVDGYTAAPMAAMPDAGFGNRADVLTSDIPAGGTMSAAPWPACTPPCWERWTVSGSSRRNGCERSPRLRSPVWTRSPALRSPDPSGTPSGPPRCSTAPPCSGWRAAVVRPRTPTRPPGSRSP